MLSERAEGDNGRGERKEKPFARHRLVYPPCSNIAALWTIHKGILSSLSILENFEPSVLDSSKVTRLGYEEMRDFRRFQMRGVTTPCARVLIHVNVTKGVAFVSDHYSVHIPINPVRRVYEEDNERNFR